MRKTLFKWHSYLALIALVPVLIISVTGSILVFKVELDSWLRPEHMTVNATAETPRQSLDLLMSKVAAANPDYVLAGWETFDDKQRSDAAYLIKVGTDDWYKVYLDQYSNQLLSEPQPMDHYLTDWLLELHYSFLLHVNGAIVGFVVAVIMLFLGISGIILYRRFWANLFTLRWQAAKRILYSDLHKFTGTISSPIILVIAFTGAYWNFMGVRHELIEHADGEHFVEQKAHYNQALSFEAMMQQSLVAIPSFKPGYLVIPHEEEDAITFYGWVDSSNPLNSEYASTVTFDKQTGELTRAVDIRESSTLHVVVDSFRKLHFGYFGGLTSRIIWCILGLAPMLLALTGLMLYLMRKRKISAK